MEVSQSPTLRLKPAGKHLDEIDAWQHHWSERGQPWRTEPEIDAARQAELEGYLQTRANTSQNRYPFKAIETKLTRADIEWLLARQSSGEQGQAALDLRGADLSKVHLEGLPLSGIVAGPIPHEWEMATDQEREQVAIHLEKADLRGAHLEGANLCGAHLEEALLYDAHLEGAILRGAHLAGAFLHRAHLEGADLRSAHLEGTKKIQLAADLRGAHLSSTTQLDGIIMGSEKYGFAPLADVHYNGVNLAVVDWSQVHKIGDEYVTRWSLPVEYLSAARANQQLAKVLRAQGMNAYADHFMHRAHLNFHILRSKRPILPVVLRIFVRERMPLPKVLMRIEERRQGVHASKSPVRLALWRLFPVLLALVVLTSLWLWLPLVLLGIVLLASAYVYPTMRKRGKHPPVYTRAVTFMPPPGLQTQKQRRRHQLHLLVGLLLGESKAKLLQALRNPQDALKRSPFLYKLEKKQSPLAGLCETLVVLLLLFDDSLVSYGRYAFSMLQNALTGFGYKFGRTFGLYLFVILGCTAAYAFFGPKGQNVLNVLLNSLTIFHGRAFFSGPYTSSPLSIVALVESIVGLGLEISFVAALIQRLYDK